MTETARPDIDRNQEGKPQSLLQLFSSWISPSSSDGNSVREAIEELIEEKPEIGDSIDEHERILLANVLKQRNATVEQIMVPRADIVSVEVSTPIADVVKLLVSDGHSRVPVYRDSLDEVIGMVHIKDLASAILEQSETDSEFSLSKVMRRVIFLAPSARVLDLLLDMRIKRTHMAMVVDEYGGIDGLVTIEDLVEQIVGEIADEHDEDENPELTDQSDGTVTADARVTLTDFVERYGPILTDEEFGELDTLGGVVFKLAGRVPSRGELVSHPSGTEFEVVEADPRRIRRLRIRNLPKTNSDL
ncbi:MAG: hemolysin family protein [Rhodospirillaceae bacterium]